MYFLFTLTAFVFTAAHSDDCPDMTAIFGLEIKSLLNYLLGNNKSLGIHCTSPLVLLLEVFFRLFIILFYCVLCEECLFYVKNEFPIYTATYYTNSSHYLSTVRSLFKIRWNKRNSSFNESCFINLLQEVSIHLCGQTQMNNTFHSLISNCSNGISCMIALTCSIETAVYWIYSILPYIITM